MLVDRKMFVWALVLLSSSQVWTQQCPKVLERNNGTIEGLQFGSRSSPVDINDYPSYTLNWFNGSDAKPCGGVLLDSVTILTTAGCVHNGTGQLFAMKPPIDRYPTAQDMQRDQRVVEKRCIAPKYDPVSHQHDLAILKISKPIILKSDQKYAEVTEYNWSAGAAAHYGKYGNTIAYGTEQRVQQIYCVWSYCADPNGWNDSTKMCFTSNKMVTSGKYRLVETSIIWPRDNSR